MPSSAHLAAGVADQDGIERLSACLAQGRRRYQHLAGQPDAGPRLSTLPASGPSASGLHGAGAGAPASPMSVASNVVTFPRANRLAPLRQSPQTPPAEEAVMDHQWHDLLERFAWAHEEALYVLRSERRDLARYHLRPRGVIETSMIYLDEFVAALARHAAPSPES